jgi:DNA-binding response OmpR family regulator
MARILVIDDDTDVLSIIGYILGSAGHSITTARDGTEALDKIYEQSVFDLVLLDIAMPNMDGWEVLKLLRSEKKSNKTKVAMLSARSGARSKIYAVQQGAVDFITKPFTMAGLVDRVNQLLNKR